MADVFLSYARQDKARAAPFVELLESQGWDVFWDQETRAGTMWPKVLEDELNQARCLIVLWTATSVASRWVRIEAYEALQNDKLLPIRLEAVKPPMEFRQTQTFDLVGWTGEHEDQRLPHLFADLRAITKIEPQSRPAAPGTPVSVRTTVPVSPASGGWPAAASAHGAPDFTAQRAPTYSGDVSIKIPAMAPEVPATVRAHESPAANELPAAHDEPQTTKTAEPATPVAIAAAPERVVRTAGGVDGRPFSNARGSRLWWGLGLAAAALVVVWIVRAVVAPSSEPPSATLKPPIVAPLPEKSPTPAVAETAPAPQAPSPTPTPVADSAPRAAVKPQRVPPARCLEIAERFQTTGQLTDEERRFLSSKECAR